MLIKVVGQWTVFPCAQTQNFARLSAPSGFSSCSAFRRIYQNQMEKKKEKNISPINSITEFYFYLFYINISQ
jgi:hypothetical protein